ncbi:MAG: 5-formyltetrahydrofolate cyclo-ligase [Proteobacteria bacterium]|nr:5-formyltetrahydrofolate cyclo-ligase [Pseudomonadota bacterium]
MPQTYIDAAKHRLAEKMRPLRREAHRNAGREAADKLWRQFQDARRQGLVIDDDDVVSGYWPIRDELDIRRLLTGLTDQGSRCALPVVEGRAKPLLFRQWKPGVELVQRPFGLSEPPDSARVLTPRVLLVPLLAVDSRGNRLGYGGGYYDRTLIFLRQSVPIVAVGIAFEVQLVADVPHDGRDAALDWVVTEKSVHRCAG